MRILDYLLFGLGVVIGWSAEKQDFWMLAFFVAYLPLLCFVIIMTEKIIERKRKL